MYSCFSWAVVLLGDLHCSSVRILGFVSIVHCYYILGVLFVCYTLSYVLLDKFSRVVMLVLFLVICVDFDFGFWFGVELLLNLSNLTD